MMEYNDVTGVGVTTINTGVKHQYLTQMTDVNITGKSSFNY